jgi:putative membrane protein
MQAKTFFQRRSLGLFLRGFAMGLCDVIPGVSGGTMALILGVYEELIASLRTLGQAEFLGALLRFRIKEAIAIVNWRFLVPLLLGIAVAVVTLARVLEWLFHNQEMLLFSFFFGLVAASIITVGGRVKRWRLVTVLMFILGSLIAFVIVGLKPTQTPDSWWFLMFSGAIAICALILPGISGAFILLLLGKYDVILAAVNTLNISVIFFVGVGAVLGLISFTQVLGWLFKHYHDVAIALLSGFMLGSLRALWPWKVNASNVWPQLEPLLALSLLLVILGGVIVLWLEKRGQGRQAF